MLFFFLGGGGGGGVLAEGTQNRAKKEQKGTTGLPSLKVP